MSSPRFRDDAGAGTKGQLEAAAYAPSEYSPDLPLALCRRLAKVAPPDV